MDSVSQAALGAAIGEAALGKRIGNKGAVLGAIVATIPDLDVFLMPLYSPLQRISIHRGYSHSILFSLLGAILLVFLFRRVKWTKSISWPRLFLFSWLTLVTHMMLDAFTSYGTQLFLPFSNARISFDSVTIVDPFYTVPLLIGIFLSLWKYRTNLKRRRIANYLGLIVSSLYLLFTLAHKDMVNQTFKRAMDRQDIPYSKLFTVPVMAAGIQWYAAASGEDSLYLGTLSYMDLQPITFNAFAINEEWLDNIDESLAEKMRWFAKGNYVMTGSADTIRFYNLQVDMQGIRKTDVGWAPTAWYYEIIPGPDGTYDLSSKVHKD